MPYKSETANEELERKESSEDPHHPAQGAGLLLSLSSNKRSSVGEEGNKASKSSTMNPITPMDGFGAEGAPVVAGVSGNHNHRLYHSPIKLNKDPASSKADHHGSRSSSWSPYHPHQGLGGRAYYPPPPPYAPFSAEEALDRRQVSDEREESPPMQARSSEHHAEEKKDDDEEDEEEEEAEQTVISPASSNEKWEDETESTPEEERSRAPPAHHHPHWPHPGMYPPWQGQAPGFPPHHPGSMPPYPPHYAAAAAAAGYPYPPPWYHGAPYPPYGMPPPGATTETTPTMEMSSAAAEPKHDDYDWHYVDSASLNRCVPLKHPPPNRFWGYVRPSHDV